MKRIEPTTFLLDPEIILYMLRCAFTILIIIYMFLFLLCAWEKTNISIYLDNVWRQQKGIKFRKVWELWVNLTREKKSNRTCGLYEKREQCFFCQSHGYCSVLRSLILKLNIHYFTLSLFDSIFSIDFQTPVFTDFGTIFDSFFLLCFVLNIKNTLVSQNCGCLSGRRLSVNVD